MNKTQRAALHRAADIIDQYADDLRQSNVVNGTWKGDGVTKIRGTWAELLATARDLREIAGERPCS